jgi:hypothetical protein
VALVSGRQQPDGSVVEKGEGPVTCARCGEVPEQVVRIIEVVVESREDLARLGEAGGPPPAG